MGNPFSQYVEVGQGEEFTIPSVHYSHSGHYKCIAFNAAGNAQSSMAVLTVHPIYNRFCPNCFQKRRLPKGCFVNDFSNYFYIMYCQRTNCRLPRGFPYDPDDVCPASGVHRLYVCKPSRSFTAITVNISISQHSNSQTFILF